MDNTKNTSAPLKACIFDEGCEVSFAETGDEKTGQFRIVAYSGQIMPDHWFWDNVAFDLKGIKFDKKKTPVLENDHVFGNRAGFTTKQEIGDKVIVEGKFLSNAKAQEVRQDIDEGFPMQASVYIPPSVIEYVKEGESTEVNGHTLKGPGAVFRKAKIKDVIICTFGKDSHTQSKTFAEGGEQQIQFNVTERENIMAKDKVQVELTAETFSADNPDLFAEITAAAKAEGETEGEKAAMERFSQIAELAKDDPAFVIEQFTAGKTVAEAQTALITRLRGQKDKAVEAAKTKAAATKKVDPAEQEFSDEQIETDKTTKAPKTPKEKYTEEFNASADIRTEFGGAEGLNNYLAFRENEDAGLAKTSHNR